MSDGFLLFHGAGLSFISVQASDVELLEVGLVLRLGGLGWRAVGLLGLGSSDGVAQEGKPNWNSIQIVKIPFRSSFQIDYFQ